MQKANANTFRQITAQLLKSLAHHVSYISSKGYSVVCMYSFDLCDVDYIEK